MAKEKYLLMRNRKGLLNPVYWNMIDQTSPLAKKLYGDIIRIQWQYFGNGQLKLIFPKKDWHRVANYIASRLIGQKGYFEKIEKRFDWATKKIDKFFIRAKKIDFSQLDNEELFALTEEIEKLCVDYNMANVPAWFMGGDKFLELLKNKINIPDDDFVFLVTPIIKTLVSQLDYDLLKYAKLIRQKKANPDKTAEKLSDDYGWIPFGYDGPIYWQPGYFKNKLRKKSADIDSRIKVIENQDKENLLRRNKIIKNYKLNKKQLRLVEIANQLAVWTDERKKYTFKIYYYCSFVLKELAKRYQVPFKNLKYLFIEELEEIKNKREEVLKKSSQRIKEPFVVEYINGQGGIMPKAKGQRILREVEKQQKQVEKQQKQEEIKGIVAAKGPKEIYQGRVKILFSPQDGRKIKPGDFWSPR